MVFEIKGPISICLYVFSSEYFFTNFATVVGIRAFVVPIAEFYPKGKSISYYKGC